MHAAHFATGLALTSWVPQSPTWAVLTGAFLPDFLWVAFARAGIEPTGPGAFCDDWSHSLVMTVLWATLFSLLFWRKGRSVVCVVWWAVFSHFVLDAPIHPKYLALYPHSAAHIGWIATGGNFALANWFVELLIVIGMSIVYAVGARRAGLPGNLLTASLVLLVGLQLLGLA